MATRRDWLKSTMAVAGVAALAPWRTLAAEQPRLITRAIPASGERLPIVGLGSSATFSQAARGEDASALAAVMKQMVELGGTVFDTAPAYGASEEVAGRIAQELGIAQRLFWATKLNVARRGGSADPAAAREQLETSFRRAGKRAIDLVQVHNMGDVPTQLPLLREYQTLGRVRYIGVTTTFESQYDDLVAAMRRERLDFIGTDYAIDERRAEDTILPLAQERGIAVLVYAPFGRTRLWARVKGRTVPEWAREFDATSWAQFFIKYVASHPAVTAVTPATSRPANMADNMGAAYGRLPDATMRRRMAHFIDGLPS